MRCRLHLRASARFPFPNFNLWPLAWVGTRAFTAVVAGKAARPLRCFLLGWLFGTVFFYGSCYWLTYSMIHFGGIPPVIRLHPAGSRRRSARNLSRLFSLWLWRAQFENGAAWRSFSLPLSGPHSNGYDLKRTGQLWNAIGYSQAYQPMLIQSARWGGVYAVGFLIVAVNAAIAFVVLKRDLQAFADLGTCRRS